MKKENEEEEGERGKEEREKEKGWRRDIKEVRVINRTLILTHTCTFLLVEVVVPRDHLHGSSPHRQTANLVVLHSTVNGNNVGRARGIVETGGLGVRGGRKIQSSMQANIQRRHTPSPCMRLQRQGSAD